MRLASLFKKTMIENFRDWKIIILTLTFAPFFVVLMYFYFGETTEKPYQIIVVNHDLGAEAGDNDHFNAGEALISAMMDARHSEGTKILEIRQEDNVEAARERLMNKAADLVVEIPARFTSTLLDYAEGQQLSPVVVKTYGDPANVRYIMAAVWSDMITYEYATTLAGLDSPLELQAESVSGLKSPNDFDLYVPGLLALALIMLMFTAAASLIKEKDKGTIVRLRISSMTNTEWLTAVSLSQIIIGLLALILTLLTCVAVGYHTSGSWLAMLVVGLLSCLSIMAISVVVSAFLRTIFDLMTIGCFPFFILMFFSGGMFPLPPLRLFTVGGRAISINDILPTTHSISALNKILNFDAGLGDVVFELAAIAILTTLIFIQGTLMFIRRHMRPC
ncbi:MAG: ABC transporter permease [Fidelibacterota bacterium]|nr:MAG: ABC transporter permease [Candidatus Neomarinimicrobiota bacterium]